MVKSATVITKTRLFITDRYYDRVFKINRLDFFPRRGDFNDYDSFKEAHAVNGAKMLREILESCCLESSLVEEACRLVVRHEFGGDPVSDLLKDADSISYFEVNLPLYYQREGYEETLRRCVWGYHRLSNTMRTRCKMLSFPDLTLSQLCLLYTSPSPRDLSTSRMPSSA